MSTNKPGLFHFYPAEKGVVASLSRAIRTWLTRPEITPKQVHRIGVLLHALQRLPLVTPQVGLNLTLAQPNESGQFWMGLVIDEERFELETGRTVRSDAGSDNESQSAFLVTTNGRAENRPGNVAGWLDMFGWMCEEAEGIELDIDAFGGEPDWQDEGDEEWWNELPVSETEDEEE